MISNVYNTDLIEKAILAMWLFLQLTDTFYSRVFFVMLQKCASINEKSPHFDIIYNGKGVPQIRIEVERSQKDGLLHMLANVTSKRIHAKRNFRRVYNFNCSLQDEGQMSFERSKA